MADMAADMWAQPSLRRAMARFAADPVRELKLNAPRFRRNIVGVAVQANLRLFGGANAQIGGYPLAKIALEHIVGLGMFVIALPGQIFVLKNPGIFLGGRSGAMTRRPCARCDAEMRIRLFGGVGPHVCHWHQEEDQEQAKPDNRSYHTVPCQFIRARRLKFRRAPENTLSNTIGHGF
jgi:hypothetical protein